MHHAPDYTSWVHMVEGGSFIGHVGYPVYPVRFFRTKTHLLGLEGCIYDRNIATLESDLAALAERIFRPDADVACVVRNWILGRDGEYLVVMSTLDGKQFIAFTDPLGRLPVYYQVGEKDLLFARECKFIVALRDKPAFDKIGWAEYLWLGYPLSRRTLFEGVERAHGGMLLQVSVEGNKLRTSVTDLYVCNFEDKDNSGRSIDDNAADLVEEFLAAVRRRGVPEKASRNVVSLSGGQDSRAVAAAMKRCGHSCVAETLLFADRSNQRDTDMAACIAESLGIPWHLIHLRDVGHTEEEQLVWIKDGLNPASMAFILEFLQRITDRWGRSAVYMTGDGGDKVFPDLRPVRLPNSLDELTQEVSFHHALLPSDCAEAIMGLKPGTLFGELKALLTTYPEEDLAQKAVHFVIYERGRKWLFEGEDRNRFFLWHTSPFYSLPFFLKAMRVPDEQKPYNTLYSAFQRQLDASVARIPDASIGYAVSSPWFSRKLKGRRLVQGLPKSFRELLRAMLRKKANRCFELPDRARLYLEKAMEGKLERDPTMNPRLAQTLLQTATERQFYNWWTLVLLEERWLGKADEP
ncbi:MAG TPA: asparagine synthase-related protein [Chthonomonadales bacterium]|nr:asparagine synthase-related protein [Chthonomonadales bacterium]